MKTRNLNSLFLTIRCLLIFYTYNAQNELQSAKSYLKEHLNERTLTLKEIDNLIVSSEYYSATTGLYHIYLNQTAQDI